jgi:predicted nucleotidyltransferase
MKYGLNKEIIRKITGVFAGHGKIDEVVLYGSRAKGNYSPGSDIDLTLKGDRIGLEQLNKIITELDDLLLPYTFDLSIYSQIENVDLISHITRVGIVFYRRNLFTDPPPPRRPHPRPSLRGAKRRGSPET